MTDKEILKELFLDEKLFLKVALNQTAKNRHVSTTNRSQK